MKAKTDWNDPAYRAHRESKLKARIEGFQKPWNRDAQRLIADHEAELVGTERGFVTALVNRRSKPSKRELDRLAEIKKRFQLR